MAKQKSVPQTQKEATLYKAQIVIDGKTWLKGNMINPSDEIEFRELIAAQKMRMGNNTILSNSDLYIAEEDKGSYYLLLLAAEQFDQYTGKPLFEHRVMRANVSNFKSENFMGGNAKMSHYKLVKIYHDPKKEVDNSGKRAADVFAEVDFFGGDVVEPNVETTKSNEAIVVPISEDQNFFNKTKQN